MNCSDNIKRMSEIIAAAYEAQSLKKLVLSKCADKSVLRAVGTVHSSTSQKEADKRVFQIESFTSDGKAYHKNLSDISEITEFLADYAQINLITSAGECEYKRSAKGSEIIIGGEKLFAKLSAAPKIEISAHNRAKEYIFDGSEPFMFELGIADRHGRVHDKRQGKFRQINRFIEHIREIYKYLPQSGRINILDLCCGKSYLSFAVYHYFTVVLGREIEMTGMDLKKDVIDFCNTTAKNLGYENLRFLCGDITKLEYEKPVHLTMSLHACDIATDIVLSLAVKLSSDVILSTPCCQRELSDNIDCAELSFITKYPMLKRKLCDAATDAMRLFALECKGYDACALELTDPDDTPKNILLRAVRNKNFNPDSPQAKLLFAEYEKTYKYLLGDKNLMLKM